jgi:hypothetical protein
MTKRKYPRGLIAKFDQVLIRWFEDHPKEYKIRGFQDNRTIILLTNRPYHLIIKDINGA